MTLICSWLLDVFGLSVRVASRVPGYSRGTSKPSGDSNVEIDCRAVFGYEWARSGLLVGWLDALPQKKRNRVDPVSGCRLGVRGLFVLLFWNCQWLSARGGEARFL